LRTTAFAIAPGTGHSNDGGDDGPAAGTRPRRHRERQRRGRGDGASSRMDAWVHGRGACGCRWRRERPQPARDDGAVVATPGRTV